MWYVLTQCPPLAIALNKQRAASAKKAPSNQIEFNVVELSDTMGWDAGLVKRELKQLSWISGKTCGEIIMIILLESVAAVTLVKW